MVDPFKKISAPGWVWTVVSGLLVLTGGKYIDLKDQTISTQLKSSAMTVETQKAENHIQDNRLTALETNYKNLINGNNRIEGKIDIIASELKASHRKR